MTQDNTPSAIAGRLMDEIFLMRLVSDMLAEGQGDRSFLLEQFSQSAERSTTLIWHVKECFMFRPLTLRE